MIFARFKNVYDIIKTMKKLFIVLGMVAGAIAGFGAAILIINLINLANTSEDSTDSTEFIEATTVNEHEINLSDYDTNIALTEAGEYLLTGEFSHLIKIDIPTDKDAEEKPQVVLKLNNVNINSSTTAIKNIYTNTLFIVTMPKTTNTIISTGDTVVDTTGHLAIDGDGALTVWNQQTIGRGVAVSANNLGVYGDGENIFIGGATATGAGISTTDRYWIDGGDVTILGTDMLEAPVDNDANRPDTKPRSASFSLQQVYPTGSVIKVLNSKGVKVATYTAPANFRTVIVSNDFITSGEYTLYIDNDEVKTAEVK